MVKISFFNQKGGPGKTTSVVNIGATLAKHFKKKVLVIDCDSQMTATKYLMTYCEEPDYTIEDYFTKKASIEDIIQQVYTKKSLSREELMPIEMYVVPSCINIETLDMKDVYDVKEMLSSVETEYDFCLFDLPPHISGISLGALVASDYVIVPAHADTDSLSGYNHLIDTIKEIRDNGWNLSLSIMGIIFNDVNIQRMIQRHILNTMREDMPGMVFKTYIKSTSAIEQARFLGIPFPYAGSLKSAIEKDYISLTKEIVKKAKFKK